MIFAPGWRSVRRRMILGSWVNAPAKRLRVGSRIITVVSVGVGCSIGDSPITYEFRADKRLLRTMGGFERQELVIFCCTDHDGHRNLGFRDKNVLTIIGHGLEDSPELLPCTHGRNFFDHTGSVMPLVYRGDVSPHG